MNNSISKVFDFHCDTITHSDCLHPMDDKNKALSLSAIGGNNWAQLYAIFIPDKYRKEEAISFYENYKNVFFNEVKFFQERVSFCKEYNDVVSSWKDGKTAAFLSVENGSVFAGDLKRIEQVRNDGVRFVTITWNGENELASGSDTNHGFSQLGKEAVKEMERVGIICDVSHLNDHSFEDFLNIATKPFAATHSNARSVCSHKRNLTDEMILEMVRRNCIIGLNYYMNFLDNEPIKANEDSLYRHICHFLELGAEKNLALGSDFDGCDLPDFIKGPQDVYKYSEYLINHGIKNETVEDLFYKNALNFLQSNS